MKAMKLLIVEDYEGDLEICRDTVKRYKDEKKREVEVVECQNVEKARSLLDNSFDGAIIDLKLADKGEEGNKVISRIKELYFRIPIAIFTGTPNAANPEFDYIGVFTKGETKFIDVFDRFWEINNTGLTRIMGGRGIIEETLNIVFLKNLLPQIDKWVTYGKKKSSRTEKALLRHVLNHLLHFLQDDEESCFPEEVYLLPPLTDKIRTGSIVKKKNEKQSYVVMNPACDLVIRNNDEYKTDRILIVEIDPEDSLFSGNSSSDRSKSQNEKLKKAYRNNHTYYYHWLPKTDFFEGGFLNFRKLSSFPVKEFSVNFNAPAVQITPSFVKDIVARFSAYYARQGQSDIETPTEQKKTMQ